MSAVGCWVLGVGIRVGVKHVAKLQPEVPGCYVS